MKNFQKINYFMDTGFLNNENIYNFTNIEKNTNLYIFLDGHGKCLCDNIFAQISDFKKKQEKKKIYLNYKIFFEDLKKNFEQKNYLFLLKDNIEEFENFYKNKIRKYLIYDIKNITYINFFKKKKKKKFIYY